METKKLSKLVNFPFLGVFSSSNSILIFYQKNITIINDISQDLPNPSFLTGSVTKVTQNVTDPLKFAFLTDYSTYFTEFDEEKLRFLLLFKLPSDTNIYPFATGYLNFSSKLSFINSAKNIYFTGHVVLSVNRVYSIENKVLALQSNKHFAFFSLETFSLINEYSTDCTVGHCSTFSDKFFFCLNSTTICSYNVSSNKRLSAKISSKNCLASIDFYHVVLADATNIVVANESLTTLYFIEPSNFKIIKTEELAGCLGFCVTGKGLSLIGVDKINCIVKTEAPFEIKEELIEDNFKEEQKTNFNCLSSLYRQLVKGETSNVATVVGKLNVMLSEMILRTDVSENKVREWENKFLKVIFAIKGCRGALWFWKNFKLYLNLRQKAMGDAFKSAWSLAEESKMRKEILEGLMKLGY